MFKTESLLRPFVLLTKKEDLKKGKKNEKRNIAVYWFLDMLSYLFCHEWFPPMYFFSVSQCNGFFFCTLRAGRWHIYTCLCSYPGEVSSTSNVTPSTDNSVPTLNSTTMLSSSQVDFFFSCEEGILP